MSGVNYDNLVGVQGRKEISVLSFAMDLASSACVHESSYNDITLDSASPAAHGYAVPFPQAANTLANSYLTQTTVRVKVTCLGDEIFVRGFATTKGPAPMTYSSHVFPPHTLTQDQSYTFSVSNLGITRKNSNYYLATPVFLIVNRDYAKAAATPVNGAIVATLEFDVFFEYSTTVGNTPYASKIRLFKLAVSSLDKVLNPKYVAKTGPKLVEANVIRPPLHILPVFVGQQAEWLGFFLLLTGSIADAPEEAKVPAPDGSTSDALIKWLCEKTPKDAHMITLRQPVSITLPNHSIPFSRFYKVEVGWIDAWLGQSFKEHPIPQNFLFSIKTGPDSIKQRIVQRNQQESLFKAFEDRFLSAGCDPFLFIAADGHKRAIFPFQVPSGYTAQTYRRYPPFRNWDSPVFPELFKAKIEPDCEGELIARGLSSTDFPGPHSPHYYVTAQEEAHYVFPYRLVDSHIQVSLRYGP